MRVVSAGYANVAIGMEIFRSSLTNNLHSQTTLGSKSFLEANKSPESFRNHSVDPRSISAWPKPFANSTVTATIEAIPPEILLYILEYLRDISTNNDFTSTFTVYHQWKHLGYSILWTNVVLTNHYIKTFARSVVEVDESICRLVRNLSIQLDPVPPKTPWDGGWSCPFSGVKYCPHKGNRRGSRPS
jgi:hypothetical protein